MRALTCESTNRDSGTEIFVRDYDTPQIQGVGNEDANGEPARRESLVSFDPDASYQWWGPDDQFVTDQHPRGFARMVDHMVRDTVPPGDPRVMLNSTVTKMAYDCPGIAVSTKDGRMFQAQQVIRELAGVNLIGADLVEVAPPFDESGGTAWLGISLMFELMCVLSQAMAARGA